MQLTTQGLVLREVNYKESDKILTVLTQDMGKLTISARGSRKKGGGISAAAQMLVWSEMTLYEYRQRWSLKEAVTIGSSEGCGRIWSPTPWPATLRRSSTSLPQSSCRWPWMLLAVLLKRPLRPGNPRTAARRSSRPHSSACHVPGRL